MSSFFFFFKQSKAAEGFSLRLSCFDLNKPFKNSSFGLHGLQELVQYSNCSNISPGAEEHLCSGEPSSSSSGNLVVVAKRQCLPYNALLLDL